MENCRLQGWHSKYDLETVSGFAGESTEHVSERVPRHTEPSGMINTRPLIQTMMENGFEETQTTVYGYEGDG